MPEAALAGEAGAQAARQALFPLLAAQAVRPLAARAALLAWRPQAEAELAWQAAAGVQLRREQAAAQQAALTQPQAQ